MRLSINQSEVCGGGGGGGGVQRGGDYIQCNGAFREYGVFWS